MSEASDQSDRCCLCHFVGFWSFKFKPVHLCGHHSDIAPTILVHLGVQCGCKSQASITAVAIHASGHTLLSCAS